jgi:hypothetical protein
MPRGSEPFSKGSEPFFCILKKICHGEKYITPDFAVYVHYFSSFSAGKFKLSFP